MAKNFDLTEETLGYFTGEDATNTDKRNLVAGSRNMIIDEKRKVKTRNGNTRLGAADVTIAPTMNATTWNTSTDTELMVKVANSILQVWLDEVDGITIDAWTNILTGITASVIPRFTAIYDDDEAIDLLQFVLGNANQYEWSGATTTIASSTSNTLTKNGTDTWARARFYASGNKTVLINGTEYTYSGGESTTTLTGVSPDPTGEADDSVVLQKVVTHSNKPASGRINHTIGQYQNHVLVGSDNDDLIYVSSNDNHTSYSQSSPRVPGEGALLTLDGTCKGFGILSERLIIFAGLSSAYSAEFFEILIGSALTETFKVKKYYVGELQGPQNPETIIANGNSIIYLSNEPAVREINSLEQQQGGAEPRTLSNPIKPDIDAEDWTNACAVWYRNGYHLSAPVNGRLYILQYKEDADGKLRRFWQTPQTMFVRPMTPFKGKLYGHSASVPESFYMFDPDAFSDINSADEKTAIHCRAQFAYQNMGKRAVLKTLTNTLLKGISPATILSTIINYGFGGSIQSLEKFIDGSDTNILEETLANVSLAQQPLGASPLGGAISAPDSTAKFHAIIELAKEDFFEMQAVFETNDIDKYWAVLAHGPNSQLSTRQPILNKI